MQGLESQEHGAKTSDEAAEEAKELASSGGSELQPMVEGQGQEVALVERKRDGRLAGASTVPSTEGAIMEQMRTHAARRGQRMALEAERRRCRDVVVPSWRVVEVGEEVEEGGEVEDMKDEVYLERHAKGEVEERRRWLSQFPSKRVGRRSKSKRVIEGLASELSDEEANELASSGESELLSMAATQAAMGHIRTNNVRVNLRKLQPKVEVALVFR